MNTQPINNKQYRHSMRTVMDFDYDLYLFFELKFIVKEKFISHQIIKKTKPPIQPSLPLSSSPSRAVHMFFENNKVMEATNNKLL